MPVQFDGFTGREQHAMNEAFNIMKRSSAAARRALLGGDLTAYSKWFDAKGKMTHLMKVATVVNQVDQAIKNRPITFAKVDRPGVNVNTRNLCGYVYLIGQGDQQFHVGSGLRILVVWATHAHTDAGYLAETMYHELTHKIGSTDDKNYDEDVCLDYATRAPHLAANNAENYNLLLREYI